MRIIPGALHFTWTLGEPEAPHVEHPNGAAGIDHVVLFTDDVDRTVERLKSEGFDFRAMRDAGDGRRQAFFVLGPCLLEVAGPVPGPERLWGITLVAPDLERFGGRVQDAVQPGRRIATLRKEAGLSFGCAFMSPGPGAA